jgi:hypothetical protein
MLNFPTEAQTAQRFPLEMFLCDLCAFVVRNLHDETGKLFQTHSYIADWMESRLENKRQHSDDVSCVINASMRAAFEGQVVIAESRSETLPSFQAEAI